VNSAGPILLCSQASNERLAGEPVLIAPVSARNSLLTGKRTGIFQYRAIFRAESLCFPNDFAVFGAFSLPSGAGNFQTRTGIFGSPFRENPRAG
jgi:hypothetical protein